MTQPVGSGFFKPSSIHPCGDDPIGAAAKNFCRNASTVAEGYLCNETTVVSNACRSPSNAVDEFMCDDRKMANIQTSFWDATREAVKMIVSVLLGRLQ